MAQKECIYEPIDEFIDIADSLINKYSDKFGDIDVSTIACVGIQNKERSEKKKQLFDVKAIGAPVSIYTSKRYVFVFHQHDWDEMSNKHRAAITADALMCIPPGGDGALNTMDYKDHGTMLRTFGVDYMDNPDIQDLIDTDVVWN